MFLIMESLFFNFVVRNDSHRQFEKASNQVLRMRKSTTNVESTLVESVGNCNPWTDCNAWNCDPDCICKTEFC